MRYTALIGILLPLLGANAQQTVRAHIRSSHMTTRRAVLWLEPLRAVESEHALPPHTYTMVQHDKMFSPSMLVVPVGSIVSFPNKDPFFHNVFSLFNGQRFDLGLYQAGQSRNITFGRAGVSYLFCNIHPEMAATIIALDTPYYAIADARGDAVVTRVPAGRYTLHVWSEFASPADLQTLAREVAVEQQATDLGTILIHDTTDLRTNHANKFGQSYDIRPADPYP